MLKGQRELLPDYKQTVDWLQNPSANDGSFTSRNTYDALNRPIITTSPDGSIYRATYNEANLLDKVDVNLRGVAAVTPFITNIDYNAKGQRERIVYGNGALSTYLYEPLTFQLINIQTSRTAGADATASQLFLNTSVVQDLHYTYDPVGNITRIEDASLRTVFNNNQQVEPVCRYTYDATYRLIEVQGREHISQTALDISPLNGNYRDHPFIGNRANPNDLQALRNYIQQYEYDIVDNFELQRHIANGGNWTRRYEYGEGSLIEPGKLSNRLTRTTVGNGTNYIGTYSHDIHGNMTSMPHLTDLVWDFEDQLQRVDLGSLGTAYYVYDASGQRVRKITESQNGMREKERIYLGGFEIYREYSGGGTAITLERETLHIMDDKQRIAMVDTRTQGNEQGVPAQLVRYQFGNHLGSASVELDDVGALVTYEEYHPYGTTAFQAGRSAAEVNLKRYRYTGKERDEETGFSYHGARYYASWLGRWASCDPIGIEDHINLYVYTGNNPVNATDPTGLQEIPTSFTYTPEKKTGYLAAARYIMKNSGRIWVQEQLNSNPELVKEVANGIASQFQKQGISLQAGQPYKLGDIGTYVPRLSLKKNTSVNDSQTVPNTTSKNNVNSKLKYFVVHDTGTSGGEKLSKYKTGYSGTVHGFIDPSGEFLSTTPFDKKAYGTKMDAYKHRGEVEMIHIELILNKKLTPTKEQYSKLAEIYNEITGGEASLIIVPHIEVDRGVTGYYKNKKWVKSAGHSDPRNFDFDEFYKVLKDKYKITIVPGETGITQERYEYKNLKEHVVNWPPVLSGKPKKH